MARARTTSSRSRHTPWTVIAILVLTLAGAWTYATSFRGVFVFDDGEAIVDNFNLRTLWPLSRVVDAPKGSTLAGRPIASVTFALNHALAPADARDVMGPGPTPETAKRFYTNIWGYHATNLAVHVLAALTLFGIARRTLRVPRLRGRFDASASVMALAIALIWETHPLQSEAVTYVVQRVESLASLWMLLALYCAIRVQESTRPVLWTAAAIGASALAMGTKEIAVALPLIVALWLWTFRDAKASADGRRRATYVLAGVALTWVVLAALLATAPRAASTGYGFGWTWWSYLVTQSAVVTHYLRLTVVPWPLVFDYEWRPAPSLAAVIPQALLLAGLAGASLAGVVRRHPAGFLGGCLFLNLAPTSSVFPIASEVAAEHRMYLPLAAIVALVVAGAVVMGRRWMPASRRLIAGMAVTVILAVTLGSMTSARNRDYWSDETLWMATLRDRPSNVRARVAYSVILLGRGQSADAERQLRAAITIDDRSAPAHMNLGIALFGQGRLQDSIAEFDRAIALDPQNGQTYGLLGEAYLQLALPEPAMRNFERAIETMPDNRAFRFLLSRVAWIRATSTDDEVRSGTRAVTLGERAVALTGRRDVAALDALAAGYAELNRFDEAKAVAGEAAALARRDGESALAEEIDRRVTAYASGRKIRQR